MKRSELLETITNRITVIRLDHPVRVAIDGVDAAGKTFLADELVAPLQAAGRPVIRASIDRFHHPADVRYRRGKTSPEGYYRDSFNDGLLVEWLLQPLGPGGTRHYRRSAYDFRTETIDESPLEITDKNAVLLFDGVFLLRPELRDYWDFSIFLHADFDVILQRAEKRDAEFLGGPKKVRSRYRQRYIPGQRLYLAEAQPEEWASIVLDNNDPENPIILTADRID